MKKSVCWKVLVLFLPAFLPVGCGELRINREDSSAGTGTQVENTPTPADTETPDSSTGAGMGTEPVWIRFGSRLCALSFEHPTTRKGPVEVLMGETAEDNEIRMRVGSDMVEPWAMADNPYPEGAYVITITYLENALQKGLGDSALQHDELSVWADLELVSNGQSTVSRKMLYTRMGTIAVADFKGLEFIGETPPNARATAGHIHSAVFANSRGRYLIITGEAPNPGPKIMDCWVETFPAVGERYQDIFRHIVESIRWE